jgi:hypothetical protein
MGMTKSCKEVAAFTFYPPAQAFSWPGKLLREKQRD